LSRAIHTAYLSLGSNLGDRDANLQQAIRHLEAFGRVNARSSLYETEPMEVTNQPWFLNCAVAFETALGPHELLDSVLSIEKSMGRQRLIPKGPRVIDIDILFFDDQIENSADLTLPHPALHQRRFVLEPLAEIAPSLEHPILNQSVTEMLDLLPSSGQKVKRI
jgi:2-amino-4-hydroxy-6-hydroxymethyldihydropteridine diphosphokinase